MNVYKATRHVVTGGLMFILFQFFTSPSKPDCVSRPKSGIKTTLTWKELRQNFDEIRWGVLEWGTFYHVYDWRLDELAAVDVDQESPIVGAGRRPHFGPKRMIANLSQCMIQNIM